MTLPRTIPFLLLVLSGCGSQTLVPVSGRVTLDGKPASRVHVGFQPIASAGRQNPGGGSYAITDDAGNFTLRLVETDQPGAVVAKHRVELTPRNDTDDDRDRRGRAPKLPLVIPPQYNRESQLTFEVPHGGTTDANFDIRSQ
jgi:hypothetical protein